MSDFRVEPEAVRTYAGQLTDAGRAAETARAYVDKWGTFSEHQKGLLGMIWPNHTDYVAHVRTMLQHLIDLTNASATSMESQAEFYERTDLSAESKVDASYRAAPRVPVTTD